MSSGAYVSAADWQSELFGERRTEILERGLVVRCEIEPGFVVERGSAFEEAFRSLVGLILSSVPDECEIFVEAGRGMAAVSRLGAGHWTIRWQVTSDELAQGPASSTSSNVIPLRRAEEDASRGDRRRKREAIGRRVARDFAAAGWTFQLDEAAEADELIARLVAT